MKRSPEKDLAEDSQSKVLKDETIENIEISDEKNVSRSIEELNSTEIHNILAGKISKEEKASEEKGAEKQSSEENKTSQVDSSTKKAASSETVTNAPKPTQSKGRSIVSNNRKKERHILSNEVEITTRKPTTTTTQEPETTIEEETTTTATTTTTTTATTATTKTTTETPEPALTLPETREERLKLLNSIPQRKGAVAGIIKTTRPPHNPVDADSFVDEREAKNPWRTHIQLHVTDESREVVDRSILKVLPKLVPVKKIAKNEEELNEEYKDEKKKDVSESTEFRDLPEPSDKDAVREQDIITPKKDNAERNVVNQEIPPKAPELQAPVTSAPAIVTSPPQVAQQPQTLHFQPPQRFQPVQGPQLPPQPQFLPQPQLVFQPQPPPQQTPITLNHFVVDGQRFIIRSYPAGWPEPPQPPPVPVQQPPPPPPVNFPRPIPPPVAEVAPQLPPLSPPVFEAARDLPVARQEKPVRTQKVIHNGNARSNAAPEDLVVVPRGHRVRQDEINVVRIFQHYGTTKKVFVRPMSTQPFTTTERPTTTTTRKPKATTSTFPTPNEIIIT